MKTSQFFLTTAVKISFVLFGLVPVISFVLLGSMPVFPASQSVISLIGIDIAIGAVLFLGYLIITAIREAFKNKVHYSSMRISA